jgi:hypothetical protein
LSPELLAISRVFVVATNHCSRNFCREEYHVTGIHHRFCGKEAQTIVEGVLESAQSSFEEALVSMNIDDTGRRVDFELPLA